jgi:hypothetical protein
MSNINSPVINNRLRNKVVELTFQYSNEQVPYKGYIIDFSKDWLLMKLIVGDYALDGYVILNMRFIVDYKRGDKERFTQKIADLKGGKPKASELMPLTDIKTILLHLTDKYGVFQFDMRTSQTCWLGKVRTIRGNNLKIDYLTPRAKWRTTMPVFKIGSIRTVQFETDYINSLMLASGKGKRKR